MIYIKHHKHGILPVLQLTESQKINGWVICDIGQEIKKTPSIKEKNLLDMTKNELEEHARKVGIELDRRKSKENMLKDYEEALNDGR